MATLTLIGEPFADLDARPQAAAARCLAEAVADTAPRGCSSRLLLARDSHVPTINSPRASIEAVPMTSASLPLLWRSGATARPLDGEYVHASTPLVPLRSRSEDDGSQSTVMVPHMLAWNAPDLMGATHARSYRSFVKRAAKHADAVLAPTHAVGEQLERRFGIDVQVVPLAAPAEYLAGSDAAALRNTLGLPDRYIATTALPGDNGRLDWILDAMQADAELPDLALIHLGPEPLPPVREALASRVHVIEVAELAEVGAVLSGANLLALPQTHIGVGYEVLGALAAHVPVLHVGCAAVAELALDAAVSVENKDDFAKALSRLTADIGTEVMRRLGLLAEDRARSFSWRSTAWQLWEIHARL